jgi:hypothetical protein
MRDILNPFRFVVIAIAGWMNQKQQYAIDYLREENRVLREQLGIRFTPPFFLAPLRVTILHAGFLSCTSSSASCRKFNASALEAGLLIPSL